MLNNEQINIDNIRIFQRLFLKNRNFFSSGFQTLEDSLRRSTVFLGKLITNKFTVTETPFGLLPLLFVDGKPLGQSMVIVRFLARQFNMEPDNCEGAAFIDAMVCTLDEQVFKLPFMEKNEEKKVKR